MPSLIMHEFGDLRDPLTLGFAVYQAQLDINIVYYKTWQLWTWLHAKSNLAWVWGATRLDACKLNFMSKSKGTFGNAAAAAFPKNLIFFLQKFNMVYMFWIVLMCWCQKWFLKNKKTSLTCILARKVIWKALATTLPNTL